jgi:hypothetical protein
VEAVPASIFYVRISAISPSDYAREIVGVSTCSAISVATRGNVFIRKWVAPIGALLDRLAPRAHFFGCSSSRRWTASTSREEA